MKTKSIIYCTFLFLAGNANANAQAIINTIAGTNVAGYSGDGGQATTAKINNPKGICVDFAGNLIVADYDNHVIRKVDASTHIIATIAGSGTTTFSGDGGAATNAGMGRPSNVRTDATGNVYFIDQVNNRVRKINASTGIITTVAGTGGYGDGGDNGPATNATLDAASGLCLDKSGNIFIADYGNFIRKVNASTGIITTIAGNGTAGYSGDGGTALTASLHYPSGIYVDTNGNVFFADKANNVVRKITAATGVINTIAGNNIAGYDGDGSAATAAELNTPLDVYGDKYGNIFIADAINSAIREVEMPSGTITTIAGTGTQGYSGDGLAANAAQLWAPAAVYVQPSGNIFIADAGNNVIREVTGNTTAIETVINRKDVSIFPNPASYNINIVNAANSDMTVYDVLGRVVQKTFIPSDFAVEDITQLHNGIYTIVLIDHNGNQTTLKIIKL